ncbi:MAG: hypothetical protein CM15mP125_0640 [Gammaproteobacteria bacterium]|nr:MAG: hypothetical protein CM15mP125_0640 [Gammaproteobacteria bacterium]
MPYGQPVMPVIQTKIKDSVWSLSYDFHAEERLR